MSRKYAVAMCVASQNVTLLTVLRKKHIVKKFFLSYFNNYRGIPFAGWLNIFSALINSGASVAIIFLSLYLTKEFHYSPLAIGVIVTGYGMGAMLGALFGGILCDYISSHLVCVISLFVNAVTLIVMPFLRDYHLIMVAVCLMGISNYAFSPANRINIMSTTQGADQMRVSSLRYMMVNLGIGAYVFLGGRLAALGYQWLFLVNGAVILLNAILLLSYLKYQREVIREDSTTAVLGVPSQTSFFIYVYLGLLLITLIFSQLRVTYPLYMHHFYHLDERLFSNIFLVNTLLIVTFQVPMANILQKVNPLLSSGLGALLIGLGLSSTYFGSTYFFAIIFCFVWTIGEILFFSTLQAMIYERADNSRKGRFMGLAQMTAAFANIVGPVTGSWLYSFNEGQWLWLVCLLFGILTCAIHFRLYASETGETVVVT